MYVNVEQMCDSRPSLSARRVTNIKESLNPSMKDFLRTKIRLDPTEEEKDGKEVINLTPRRPRKRNADGSCRITSDDIAVSQRRAFEVRHQQEARRMKKVSEKDWRSRTQYHDWRSKQSMKRLEPHRVQKDRHVIEDVIQERHDYFVGSLSAQRIASRTHMGQTREFPSEMRVVSQATKRTQYW